MTVDAITDGDGLTVFSETCAYLTNATGWDGSPATVCLNPERQRYTDMPNVIDALDESALSE